MKRFAIVAWVATAAVVGCAAGQRSQVPSAAEMPAKQVTMPVADPHQQIEALDQQIETERTKMGLQPVVAPLAACSTCPVAPVAPFSKMPTSHDPACRPASNDTCRDSCTLSDSICVNADRICSLAQEMQGDSWAAGKCTSGKATCEAAHEKCCSCQ